MTGELLTMDQWMGYDPPVARSLSETAEGHFRAQDLADRDARKRSQRLAAERQASRQDLAELHAFMGHQVVAHADVLGNWAAAQDRLDEFQAHREAKAARAAEQARQDHLASLEAEVAASARSQQRSMRTLRQANEAAAAFRRQAEEASFRDARYEPYRGADGILHLQRIR